MYRRIAVGEGFCALSPSEQERALHANAEILLSVAEELGFAALTVPNHYWEIAPGAPAYYWLPPKARFRQIEILCRAGRDRIMLVGGSGGVMAMPGASSYVEFSYKLYDAPQEIDRQAAQTLEHGLETAKRLRDLGIEAVFTASDIADNRGLFFNPAQMERFILPYLRRWAERVKEMGLYTILHTDGDVYSCLEDLAESGIDALQAIDPVAGMDMRAVKDAAGDRLCLCGNVDCGLLVMGTPEKVHAATHDLLLDCKAGGGLVLGASNAVQEEVPIENYWAMVEAWREFGQY
jgi:uroporphyrinogen decarboxylase